MEVRLDRIAEERFEWSESFSIPASELAETDLVDLGEIQCRGRIERTSHTSYLLTSTLEYRQTLACVRCLRELESPVSSEIQLLINVDKSVARSSKSASERAAGGLMAPKASHSQGGHSQGGHSQGGHEGADGEELELVEEDLGVVTLSEPLLDTRPIVVEQLHLGIPMKPLCREDCKGLCSSCGEDLNEGPCSCAPVGDPRLAKLAALRGKIGGEN